MHDHMERTETSIEWPSPPSNLSIQHGAVHVWAWDYKCSTDDLSRYVTLLSPEENSRMLRFHFENDRVRYIVSHAVSRMLLGQYLGAAPSSISFYRNEFGRPGLAPALSVPELTFNLSHTNRVGLLAVAADLTIGVDVEEVRPVEPGTVERYFSAKEQADLTTLTGADWLEGFYNCWTRKEAILKAEGIGLGVSLNSFDVSLRPNAQAAMLGVRVGSGLTSSWHLSELRPAFGIIGALATDAPPASVLCYRFAH